MSDWGNTSAVPTGYMSQADIMKMLFEDSRQRRQSQQQAPMLHPLAAIGNIAQQWADARWQDRLLGAAQSNLQNRPDLSDPFGGGGGVSGGSNPSASLSAGTPSAAGPGPASAPDDLFGFIKAHEGYSPTAYPDGKQISIGFGTKANSPNETIDQEEAGHRLNAEVDKAAGFVQQTAPHAPDGVKRALTDLSFNTGQGWANAGLGKAVAAGDWDGARNLFLQYNRANGQVLPGLTARRQQAAAWFPAGGQPGDMQMAQAGPGGFHPPTASMSTLPDMGQINRLRRSPDPQERAFADQLYQRRLDASKPQSYEDPEGHRWEGTPYGGFTMVPGPSKSEAAGASALSSKLAEARAKPVGEALERGSQTGNVIRGIDALMTLSNSPQGQQATSGPLWEAALKGKQFINNMFPGYFEDVAPAEAMTKLNAFLASGSAHELTNRATQFDFKTFMANNPGLNQSPAGREMTADILKQMAQQDREISRRLLKSYSPDREMIDIEDKVYSDMPIKVHVGGKTIYSTDPIKEYGAPGGGPPPSSPDQLSGDLDRRLAGGRPPPSAPGAGLSPMQQNIVNALFGKPGGDRTGASVAQSVGFGDNPQASMTPEQSWKYAAANAGPAVPGSMLIPGAPALAGRAAGTMAGPAAMYWAANEIGMPAWLKHFLENKALVSQFGKHGTEPPPPASPPPLSRFPRL